MDECHVSVGGVFMLAFFPFFFGFGFLAFQLLGFSASGFLASFGFFGFLASWLLLVYAAFGGFLALAFRILSVPPYLNYHFFKHHGRGLPPPTNPRYFLDVLCRDLIAPLFGSSLFRASKFARKCCRIRHFM